MLNVTPPTNLNELAERLKALAELYYSLNRQALSELNAAFGVMLDPARIKPRRPTCGPQGAILDANEITII